MPSAPVPPDVSAFLALPNPGVVATLKKDGSPTSAATWYDWEDGRVYLNMDEDRTRLGHMRRDPRVALTVIAADNWYWQVSLRGRVVDLSPDEDLSGIDRLSRRYTGEAYPVRDHPRFGALVEVESWDGWDGNRAERWEPGVTQAPV